MKRKQINLFVAASWWGLTPLSSLMQGAGARLNHILIKKQKTLQKMRADF